MLSALSNLRVATQLGLSFGLCALCTLIACTIGWWEFRAATHAMSDLVAERSAQAQMASDVSTATTRLLNLTEAIPDALTPAELDTIVATIEGEMAALGRLTGGSASLATKLETFSALKTDMSALHIHGLNLTAERDRLVADALARHETLVTALRDPVDIALIEMVIASGEISEVHALQTQALARDLSADLVRVESVVQSWFQVRSAPDAPAGSARPIDIDAVRAKVEAHIAEIQSALETGKRALLEGGVNRINAYFLARAEANMAVGILVAAATATDLAQLNRFEERFVAAIAEVDGALEQLALRGEAVDGSVGAMAYLSDGQSGSAQIFDVRRRAIAQTEAMAAVRTEAREAAAGVNAYGAETAAATNRAMAAADAALAARLHVRRWVLVGIGLAATALVFSVLALQRQLLIRPLAEIALAAEARGQAPATLHCLAQRNEIGALARAVEAGRASVDAAQRLRMALDACKAMVLVCDADGRLVHANPAMAAWLDQAAATSTVPPFSTGAPVGPYASVFGLSLADGVPVPMSIRGSFANWSFETFCADVSDSDGHRIGAVVEVTDRTGEIRREGEIDATIDAVLAGALSHRADIATPGVEGVNRLADIMEGLVGRLTEGFQALAEGDLAQRSALPGGGAFVELKDTINTALDRLDSAIDAVRRAADTVDEGVEALGTQASQARTLISRTSSGLGSTVEELANVSRVAQETTTASDATAELAADMDLAARGCATSMEDVSAQIDALCKAVEEIAGLTGRIDTVATETQMIAINAGIEAARAGESGRTFAVVAEEVQSLSLRVAENARTIGDIVARSQELATTGAGTARGAHAGITDLAAMAKGLRTQMSDLNVEAREQAAAVGRIDQTVDTLRDSLAETEAASKASDKIASNLAGAAAHLRSRMAFFRTSAPEAAEGRAS
ncbi:MAG: methyl-accepting chemotaxis protein [Pseudomonadota bacterium]